MSQKRTRHPKGLKFRAAIAMIKNDKSVTELCQEFQTNASVLHRWKKELLEKGVDVFEVKGKSIDTHLQIEALEKKVGQLTMENDFFKKVSGHLQ